MKNKASLKLLLAVFPTLFYYFSRIWFSTCRVEEQGTDNLEAARAQGGVIGTVWHYSIVYFFYHLYRYGGVVLVSASRDGEIVARTAERFGLEVVRGSSNRQGVQALKKLLRAMKDGKHLGIVADGSQGPPRILQPGAVYLSSRTRACILPMAWAADRCYVFNSWDKMVLPKLFSRIVLCYGRPITVPADANADGIEAYRREVEGEMNRVYDLVWDKCGRKSHDDGPGKGERK